ncbi:MAG: hypothetical protein KQI35_04855 [Bacteroidetes bacterium]|nr:hypothetical protein [Bacteroidota bacterium]
MKSGNIFWGLLLIVLGALIFMRNFDIFFFSWGSILRLWPLLFVFWGISVLPVKSGVKILLSVATIALGLILLATNPHGGFFWNNNWNRHIRIDRDDDRDKDYEWDEQQFKEAFNESTEMATLNLTAAAGSYSFNGTTDELFEFRTEGNVGPYTATVDDVGENEVVIHFSRKHIRGRDNLRNSVWMYLNETPLWTMNIDVGAAELEMDLTPFRIERIDMDGGASDIVMKIGDRHDLIQINIDAGAAGINIKVPEASACEVKTHTVLSGRNLEGFNKISNGIYQTPNFSDSANQVIIDIEAAVSGVTVERY